MASIDRIDWHSGGEFPEDLPPENGGTHIGMYLNWIIDNGLIGKFHREESIEGLKAVELREITGRDFLLDYCDGKFWSEDLNEIGLAFTKYYYGNADSSDPNDMYLADYMATVVDGESVYAVENSWENYELIAACISKAYDTWQNKKRKRAWQFWKK